MAELLFLCGPSGTGKSWFASRHLARQGWLHMEIDLFPRDGIDVHGLREPWDDFFLAGRPHALANELRRRLAGQGGHSGPGGHGEHGEHGGHGSSGAGLPAGMVLSFPGRLVFSPGHLKSAAGHFRIAILHGRPEHCEQGFLRRESGNGRGLSAAHWRANNLDILARLADPLYRPFRVEAFHPDGSHRSAEAIQADVFPSGQPTSGQGA